MGGYLTGCDSWFQNPASEVSAHYGVGLLGDVHQYVDLAEAAWANGRLESGNTWPGPAGANPNSITVSIETEDNRSNTPVTDAQYQACVAVGRLVVERFPSVEYLMSHRVISPQSRVYCPGVRWTESGRFAALAAALGLEAMA